MPNPYFEKLLNEGVYCRAAYGSTTAFVVRGNNSFLQKSCNLFESFGTEPGDRPLLFYPGAFTNSLYFCSTPQRVIRALRRYLYGQICGVEADKLPVYDEEGDIKEIVYLNEDAMMQKATELAQLFYDEEILVDSSGLPDFMRGSRDKSEYRVFEPENAAHE